jgi:hypothetical protein
MERTQGLKKNTILNHLTTLPQKVLALHGVENVTEFVLHDLCNHNCFDLQKAAYLVDNPDFNVLKGIAGFSAQETFSHDVIWETPELFMEHMKQAPFNQKVRTIWQPSMHKVGKSDQEVTQIVADYLGLVKPAYCSWQMKHDNHGILIYEEQLQCPVPSDLLKNGACLLGFCPIY